MTARREIEVCADWADLKSTKVMGRLFATPSRGTEIFSFEYDQEWLEERHLTQLDPGLGLYRGPQHTPSGRQNFGLFLDSSPDRWGRVLMQRREAHRARVEKREEHKLLESDYLLGVHDGHRMGALRFRTNGTFLDDSVELATPPWTSLRELEHASLQLERDDAETESDYGRWLRMLIAPGGSLGGARPKASVLDNSGDLWIAKFPSRNDTEDVGAWESVIHDLAIAAGIQVPKAKTDRFGSKHRTFMSRRFDRTIDGQRLHFASAMTLLDRKDGDCADDGTSYLELAEVLIRLGANTASDLEQLWRRMVFFVCVSNTDDHLRNHGFMLTPKGWILSPAYDMNPDPHGDGLRLNISDTDNAQDLDLLREVAPQWRIKPDRASKVIAEVTGAVKGWRQVAGAKRLSKAAQNRMRRAFRVAES